MNKAVFLDRDGVINFEKGHYTTNLDDFIINKGVGAAIKLLKDNGYLVIVISNQGGIAKALYTHEDVLEMHIKFCEYLFEFDTKIDDFFYCPHHQDYGKCLCRKPEALLFEKAIKIYNIDVKNSLMIGDSDRDIQAAAKCGINGIKIKPNENILEICKQIVGGVYG
ncbi:MAG: HAD family hydrolase [Bacteroidales bacterium]|jgi:D-glycero-D-manno-heptose 1,7-bisphosphate phosphatase|nr:HAD family hydrolase [Bacteroidales bacterium]MDY0315522.1 HAD family hydrolase [Bacteroidales bacterium]NLB86247.1 HAD family hydrolase [Bacteroidales bacterium]